MPQRLKLSELKLYARAGDAESAVAAYLTYLDQFPLAEDGPFAAWWSASLLEELGRTELAAARFRQLANLYPDHEDAPEAMFRAGWLYRQLEQADRANEVWAELVQLYPNSEYGSTALLWLIRRLPQDAPTRETFVLRAEALQGTNYYALRAQQLAQDVAPFPPSRTRKYGTTAAEQAVFEDWFVQELGLDLSTADVVSEMPASVSSDPRLIRGEKLWRLGLYGDARSELDAVREASWGDMQASYALSLYFRELGNYRGSIGAATSVLHGLDAGILEVPPFLAKLIYPTYYSDIIDTLALQYGYDPLLHFSLVRQESLYESFATSSAVAQGLSQVIPDTGIYIAQKLGWPNYSNDDLYRPIVGLTFGAYYLDEQLDRFDRNEYAALAAYNAGPGNAQRWFDASEGDYDIFLEEVNFGETRLYIRRIFVGHVIYSELYGE